MTDGSQQDQRFPMALAGGAVLVDPHGLPELLAISRDFAEALAFRGAAGAADGTWADLLDRDESVLIARGMALRVDHRRQRFLDDLAAGRSAQLEEQVERLRDWLSQWLDLIAGLDRPEARALGERIDRRTVQILGADWRVAAPRAEAAGELRNTFFGLARAIEAGQELAAAQLPASLGGMAHEPATGLLLALIQIYSQIQREFNGFQERHLDFYYHGYLKLQPRGANPDSVHLIAQRDPRFPGEVIVPAGQLFNAGRTEAGQPILFQAPDGLSVTDAQVAALKSLRFNRDAMISPECLFGMVTRARVAEFGADVGVDSANQRQAAALLGGVVQGCVGGESEPRIGLAVSSPILWLSQGDRSISVVIGFQFPTPPSDDQSGRKSVKQTIKEAFANARGQADFVAALRLLFANWLLSDELSQTAQGAKLSDIEELILDAAEASNRSPPLDGVAPMLSGDPSDIWRRLLGDSLGYGADAKTPIALDVQRILAREELFASSFTIEVSTATGWLAIGDPIPQTDAPELQALQGFLGLNLTLTHEDPPIVPCSAAVHGPEWPTDAPVLRFTLRDTARVYPLSLLDHVVLTDITIEVQVDGLRDLQAYNQVGQLDPSKPFQPFGPVPDTASYLIVASPETARKALTEYRLTFDWAGLPDEGLAQHYSGYDADFSDDLFAVSPFALRDGRWQALGPPQPLFDTPQGVAVAGRTLSMDSSALVAYWRPSDRPPAFDQNARDGFLKLQLTAPKAAFGHALYPIALTNALRAGLKKTASPPNPPYTPVLGGLTLGYAAATRIQVGAPAGSEQILHLHPFGTKTIQPAGAFRQAVSVLPNFGRDGQLAIGLSAQQLQGEINLLFELRPDTAGEADTPLSSRPPLEWSWLANDIWTPLGKERVISDTTRGFLTTGIVRLDLPPGPAKGNSILAGDLFWLRVCNDLPSNSFAGLLGVKAQALLATRVLGEPPEAPLPAGSITLKSASIPGVVGLSQPAPGFGLRPAETPWREQTRIGERLQHKMRASTPWDYERLVLEAFPDVYKVRCLPATRPETGEIPPGAALPPSPGDVLIVVVPIVPTGLRNDPEYSTRALRLNAGLIEDIERFLPPLASPFARIRVINATFEFIQVRCKVALKRGAHIGEALASINEAIVAFLSPWCDGGYPLCFDWVVRSHDMEGCVRAVSQVQSVTGVSLIRVWQDDRKATRGASLLDDTGDERQWGSPPSPLTEFSASRPWSLALPVQDHIIEVIGLDEQDTDAQRTGLAQSGAQAYAEAVAGLQIGETFIVDKSR